VTHLLVIMGVFAIPVTLLRRLSELVFAPQHIQGILVKLQKLFVSNTLAVIMGFALLMQLPRPPMEELVLVQVIIKVILAKLKKLPVKRVTLAKMEELA